MAGPVHWLQVDTSDVKRLSRDLETLSKKSAPYAMRNALTDVAFDARGEWSDQMRSSMTLRNTYTQRSLGVRKASGTNLRTMQSQVGSRLDYVAEREAGSTHVAHGKHGVPIPTSSAAGQGLRAKRTRVVQRANYQTAIHLNQRGIGAATRRGRQQRNAVTIAMAQRKGNRFVFLDLGRRKGIFKLTNSKRKPVRMVYDLSRKSIRTKPNPMRARAIAVSAPRLPGFLAARLVQQLRYHRILHYSRSSRFGY
jgi:hypothetical protein